MRLHIETRDKERRTLRDKYEVAKFVQQMLVDDLPQIYNDEWVAINVND